MKSDTDVVTMADKKQAAVKLGLSQWQRQQVCHSGRDSGKSRWVCHSGRDSGSVTVAETVGLSQWQRQWESSETGGYLSRNMRKPTMWILTRSDTNQAVQLLEMASGWKFWIQEEVGLYYPSSENKGADQLRGFREADLAALFSHMPNVGYLGTRLICSFINLK